MIRRRAVVAVLAFVTGGCATAARPTLEPSAFPFATDSLRTQRMRDGAQHHFIYSSTGPWAIHVLDVRLDRCLAAHAVKGAPGAVGRERTSRLLRDLARSSDVIGGVNADFFLFDPPGVPTGAHVESGRVITPPSGRPVFAVDSAGTPHIVALSIRGGGTFRAGDSALARVSLAPFHPMEAVGGRPVLARDSVAAPLADTAAFTASRHPRTAVGIADRGRRLLLVVVDGRQKPYSDGMTLRELASLMLALGARDALNLDGGGSTTLVYADPDSAGVLRVANHPSDAAGERPVGNVLAIVRTCGRRD